MKKFLAGLNMLLASIFPVATTSNKKQEPLPTTGEQDTDEIVNTQSVIQEAVEIAAAARRIDEETAYRAYGMSRPNSENRFVITMNDDGTYDATVEKDPNGTPFIPVTQKDRENYEKLKKSGSFNNIEMERKETKTYKININKKE